AGTSHHGSRTPRKSSPDVPADCGDGNSAAARSFAAHFAPAWCAYSGSGAVETLDRGRQSVLDGKGPEPNLAASILSKGSLSASGFSALPARERYKTNKVNNPAASPNFSAIGKFDGEINPSMNPATSSSGMVPKNNLALSLPARTRDSLRGNAPGNNNPRAMMNPAPPAMKMAGNSRTPWAATKLHKERLMP